MQSVDIMLSIDENQDQALVRVELAINGEPVVVHDGGPAEWKAITRAVVAQLGPEAEAAIVKLEQAVVDSVRARSAREAEAETRREAALRAWGVK